MDYPREHISELSDISSMTNSHYTFHRNRRSFTQTRGSEYRRQGRRGRRETKPTSAKDIAKQVFVFASFVFSAFLIDHFTTLVFQSADPLARETNLRGGELPHATLTEQKLLVPQLLDNEGKYAANKLDGTTMLSPSLQEQQRSTLIANESNLRGKDLQDQTLTQPKPILLHIMDNEIISQETKLDKETLLSSLLQEKERTASTTDGGNPREGELGVQHQKLAVKQPLGNEIQDKNRTISTTHEVYFQPREILKQIHAELRNRLCRKSCSNYGVRLDGEPACCDNAESQAKQSSTFSDNTEVPAKQSPTLLSTLAPSISTPPPTSTLNERNSLPSTTVQWTPPQQEQPIRPYNYHDIEKSASMFEGYYARVLIFDGIEFSWWSMLHKNVTTACSAGGERAMQSIPMLVHALKKNFPERFVKGQPPFQMMTSDGDAVNFGACTSDPGKCDMEAMPPLLVHGSVPARKDDFPFIKAYPNWNYGQCLYNLKILNQNGPCESPWFSSKFLQQLSRSIEWDKLKPTLIWRGSDHAFLPHVEEYKKANYHRNREPMIHHIRENSTQEELVADLLNKSHELTPRWLGVTWTVQEDLALQRNNSTGRDPWIDVRFFENNGNGPYHMVFNKHGVNVKADEIMHPQEMASYKYQLDLGGGGGTTWRGTLTKLAMPGVLFHHVTSMEDWFFKDLMVPWKHYIPIDWQLGNLKERYEWAEQNPAKCKEISQAATELVKYIMSEEYMETLYQYLYRDHLGRIIDAYQPTEIEKQKGGHRLQQYFNTTYNNDGFIFHKVFQCNDAKCEETSGSEFLILS